MTHWTHVPSPAEGPRKQPVSYFAYPLVDTDTLTYALPDGFAVEAVPDPVHLETPFASYQAAFEPQANGAFQYRRRVEVRTAELPPDQYEAFRAFLQRVARADHAQVVLVEE